MTNVFVRATLATLLLASPASAQDPAPVGAEAGRLPQGWQARFDRADATLSDVRFVADDGGFRVVHGPAAVYFAANRIAFGSFAATATFEQESDLPHPEGYGLLIGGSDLDGTAQRYTYFLIRQDGRYLVKRRSGERMGTLVDWTAHDAIRPGAASNVLTIVAERDSVTFLANGVQLTRLSRATLFADGMVGFRVNHRLSLRIRDIDIRPR